MKEVGTPYHTHVVVIMWQAAHDKLGSAQASPALSHMIVVSLEVG